MRRLTRLLLSQFARVARPYLEAQGLLRTTKVFSGSALAWTPGAERVLVLAPHMDDETIGCGGALALHVAAGANVHVVFLTDGGAGAPPGALSELDAKRTLVELRKREAVSALGVLGVSKASFLDAPDGGLLQAQEASGRLHEILMQHRPELVYVPCFLEEHPDHYAASRILVHAAMDLTFGFQCMGYEVWTPLFPNTVVAIDAVVELKREALSHYKSQLASLDYIHTAMGLNSYRSAAFTEPRIRFAEAFFSLPLSQYAAAFEAYGRRH
jgi:N-acetylglucosamine malate deacetylase 1